MDKEKSLLRIATNLDTIKAHVNRLKRAGYKVHTLDIDMLRTKAIDLYEQIIELEELAEGSPVVKTPVKEEPKIETPKPEPKPEIVEEVTEVPKVVEPEVKQVPVVAEPHVQEETPDVSDVVIEEMVEEMPVKVELEVKEEPDIEVPSEPEQEEEKEQAATAYDLFSGSAESPVGEKYAQKDEPSVAEKIQKSQIVNIREAIGINEKFLFINELFNGDMSRYNKILDDINALPTQKGVETYLLEMKIQFQWADDNEAFVAFKELIERKFQ